MDRPEKKKGGGNPGLVDLYVHGKMPKGRRGSMPKQGVPADPILQHLPSHDYDADDEEEDIECPTCGLDRRDCGCVPDEPEESPDGETRIERTPDGRFAPGNSLAKTANPHGRPPADRQDQALARVRTKRAIETLDKLMTNGKVPPNVRLDAIREMLDRGWGKVAGSQPEQTPLVNIDLRGSLLSKLEKLVNEDGSDE